MHLRYALLALLADGEAHGYELRKRFMSRVGPFWHPNVGQVYQVLHQLERRGHVRHRDDATGARLRRLFRLTLKGERALRTWLARRPSWPPPLRDEIIVRVLATERHGTSALVVQLERQEAEYRRYLTLVQSDANGSQHSLTRRVAHEAAVGLAEAHLRWLARCRELLAAQPRRGDQFARERTSSSCTLTGSG
ncbi:MAG TPA: helix-turn-helix transcriptional regulator [Candidatus Eisenbacteria bacterium]|nr:helix-turn-helix transcriptional regulator [Candidatus Eisenbacteria bacterium]